MTTFTNRPNTALLIVDVQNGVVADVHDRDAVLANIGSLVDRAHETDTPVIWVQHQEEPHLPFGSEEWKILSELDQRDDDHVVAKRHGDAFEATDLEGVLEELQVGKLIVAGAQTDQCIRGTLHGSLVRGYDTILVADAHSTSDLTEYGAPTPDKVIAHTNLYWSYESAEGREAGTVAAADVAF